MNQIDFRSTDLRFINSITKYPPIPTLHALGDRGIPTDEVLVDFGGCVVDVTEKIDGTNARILLSGYSFAIGSRENLLTVNGDVLYDPAQDIVAAIRDIANDLTEDTWDPLRVVYGEVYGGKVTGSSKQYTSDRAAMRWRVFDVVDYDCGDLEHLREMSPEEVSRWREGPRVDFMETHERVAFCRTHNLDAVPGLRASEPPPTDRRLVMEWLGDTIPESLAKIDATGLGKPEGVVVRTPDRSRIAKVRFDDYRKVK